jgi:hypothetical protein
MTVRNCKGLRSYVIIVDILSTVARVGFVQSSYAVSETSRSQEVCIEVFNPPLTEDLAFDITLVYETRTGTAGECINKIGHCI